MKIDWITATEIDNWARQEPRQAQEILPKLIIKLILSTSNKIDRFNFPIEKGIQYAGYDGTLESSEQTKFFPNGKSVWEFGTDIDAIGKFKSDIEKRSDNPLGVDIRNTVFIFATLKIWNHRSSIEEVINEYRAQYDWKNIVIIDAQTIAMWLEECPSVVVWFSKIIGKHIQGVISIEDYWEDKSSTTKPNLIAQYFLIGREQQFEELKKWFDLSEGYKVITAESGLESALFIIATILNLEDEKRESLISRSVIVESINAWQEIITRATNQTILIPIFNFTDELRCPKNICAILPISKFSSLARIIKNISSMNLPKFRKTEFDDSLKLMGFDINDYSKIEIETKRSFLPFYRKITTVPMRKQPKWTVSENIRDLIPAMFVGGWNSNYAGDKKIIEILSGRNYDDYISSLSAWMSIEDSPIFSIIDNFRVVSVHDLWNFLFLNINKSDIEKLNQCILDVFKMSDPKFELPEEHWYMAQVLGKRPEYSQFLVQGLVITMIMLSERDGEDNNFGSVSTKMLTYHIIKQILVDINTWQHWHTIVSVFPLLAEASPAAVIERIEEKIPQSDIEFWNLFQESKDVLMGTSYYTYLLWTLEQLVWEEEYSVRAIILLAKISEKKFNYKLVNSPQNSLYQIFCIWNPQSCLSTLDRMDLLKELVNAYPSTGWKLLKSLLPSVHAVCGQICKPKWRESFNPYSNGVTEEDRNYSVERLIAICSESIRDDVEQWEVIIDNFPLFREEFGVFSKKFIEKNSSMPESDIITVCKKLRKKIYEFRKFKDAAWSIQEEDVVKLETLLNLITPKTIIQYKYLFDNDRILLNPIPYVQGEKDDYEAESLKIYEMREMATIEMLEKYGVEEFLSFCYGVDDTRDLGKIISEKIFDNKYNFSLLQKIQENNNNLYSNILWNIFSKNGLETLINEINKADFLSKYEIGIILCHTPMNRETWEEIEKFEDDIVTYYWHNVNMFRLLDTNDFETEYYIKKLLKYDRPFSLMCSISYSEYNNSERIIEILHKAIELHNHSEKNGMSIKSIDQSDIINLFNKLYDDLNVDRTIVVKLEIIYLSYFKSYGTPQCLIECLSKNPEEFINVISTAYKADGDLEKEVQITEQEQICANKARDILDYFTEIPGCNNKMIDETIFNDWIIKVGNIAKKLGYTRAFQICIGKLLSYAPIGSDGIFPHEFVRNYLENNLSQIIENEFIVGKRNQRGVYYMTRGKEEEQIAQKYKTDAKNIRIKYTKTSSILQKLSENYFQESQYQQQIEMNDFN